MYIVWRTANNPEDYKQSQRGFIEYLKLQYENSQKLSIRDPTKMMME
jgi:hypothetical protein